MKKFVNLLMLLVGCLFYASNSYSSCVAAGAAQVGYINLGAIAIQRDVPVGTVLKTITSSYTNQKYDTCTGGGYEYDVLTYPGSTSTSIANVYSTNISGIGIRAYFTSGKYFSTTNAARYISINSEGYFSIPVTVEVVKTGDTGSGSFTTGQIYKKSVDGGATVLSVMLTGGSVTTMACTINNNTVNVPLETVLASSFTGVNSTKGDKPFTIGLSCDAGARINASLSFTQNTDTSNNSIIQLTGAGNSDVATGVGIQLLYGSTPLQRNTNIVLKTSTGGQEFPSGAFTARYFQTKSTVTTGNANATATLNLTYQ